MKNGKGFLGDIWNGLKSVGSVVNDIARKTGIISKVAAATGNPIVSGVAGSLGYGKKKRRMKGHGLYTLKPSTKILKF